MICEYVQGFPERLGDLTFPPAANRKVWEAVPEDVRRALIARGEEWLDRAFPALSCTDYLTFARTGERTGFEEKYFARRKALCALALAECAEYQGRFLDALANVVWAVCEESGWQLPPHNNYVRDTAPLPLPDADRPVPDLFACETAASLSIIRQLLGAELNSVDPAVCRRIHREVDRRVVGPWLHDHFWWMGNGDEPMCNWTSWCTQNALLAVFTSGYGQEVKRAAAKQAAYSLDCFLKDYGPDGCCEEGALYYRHAGLTLWGALEVLDRVTGGSLAPVFREEKIRNIAAYITNVHVDGDYYLNYADCSPKPGSCGVREYLFGRRTENSALCALATIDVSRREERDLPDEISLFIRLLDVLYAVETAKPLTAAPPPEKVYYPSTGLWIARKGSWCVSVRAGHNGGSHGHCDAGSLILYCDGRPLLIDIGVESYTAKTFSSQRGSIWTIRSDWHNLPTLNGAVQGSGRGFGVSGVTLRDGPGISMELASAYPGLHPADSYRRTVSWEGGDPVVEDVWQGKGPAVLSLLLCEKPIWQDGALETKNGGILLSAGVPEIESIPVTDPRLRQGWPDMLYRVRVPVEGRLVMKFFKPRRN